MQYIFLSFEWPGQESENFCAKKSSSHLGRWTSPWACCASYQLNHVTKVYTKWLQKKNFIKSLFILLTLLITLLSIYVFSQFLFFPIVTHNYKHTKIENRCYTYDPIPNKGNLTLLNYTQNDTSFPIATCFFY
jgi:hypothetical protein